VERKEKADGRYREIFDAFPALKKVQGKIKDRILLKVCYPSYLQGGIKDLNKPRDYVRNAAIHAGATIILSEDVADFFPSTTARLIHDVWKRFFNFPEDVAACLTKLTTKNDQLPQGAKTSSYLANLVFWDCEPRLYDALRKQGVTYSRFVDDISLSCRRKLTTREQTQFIAQVYGMLGSRGYRPKRSKHKIFTSGQRMAIHRLTVNAKKPTLPQKEQSQIRSIVAECEGLFSSKVQGQEYNETYNRASGKVAKLARLHPIAGRRLRERLARVRPRHK